jgi:hypothetical protein
VTIKHRIQRLENKHLPSIQRIYVIVSKYGETRAEAEQRYCTEKGIPIQELKAPGAMVRVVRFVKPGDALAHILSAENG